MKITPSKIEVSFNKLIINSVDTNSGIFIGVNNLSHGWSSHSKSNNGFGDVSSTTITKSFSIIYDNDAIDAPIIDFKKFLSVQPKQEPLNTDIHFSNINVNGMNTNTSVSIGDIDQAGWSSHSKSNTGEGSNTGISQSKNNHVLIVDNDQIDAPILNNHNIQEIGE